MAMSSFYSKMGVLSSRIGNCGGNIRMGNNCVFAHRRVGLASTPSSSSSSPAVIECDLAVIGGGSAGLACSKEAAGLGARTVLIDAVTPSPHGTSWGIGGTCVNVGCIPKKLMHLAAIRGRDIQQAESYGWNVDADKCKHDWHRLVQVVSDRIKASNWIYRVQLNDKRVRYVNATASFVDRGEAIRAVGVGPRHTEMKILARHTVIATGLRPRYPSIVGAEHGISSDDVFSLKQIPGRCCVVGGSYVGLECAGFLRGLGFPVDLVIRSIPLRNFDQQCSNLVVDNLKAHGVNVLWQKIPHELRIHQGEKHLTLRSSEGNDQETRVYDTVIWAIGREPRLAAMDVQAAGVTVDQRTGKIVTDARERTSNKRIFAIGDVVANRAELTPAAIRAGQLLARRLFGDGSAQLMNYDLVPTTVFTPLEFACVGLAEERAIEQYGIDDIEVFHSYFVPYEYVVPQDDAKEQCYMKVICHRRAPHTVIGIFMVGPNAAEVLQGFAAAMTCDLTMRQLMDTIAIHPCSAEELVKLSVTKRSGDDPHVTGCCG